MRCAGNQSGLFTKLGIASGIVIVVGAMPASAATYVTTSNGCPTGTVAADTGNQSGGQEIYQCVTGGSNQATTNGFQNGNTYALGEGYYKTTAPIDAPGWGDSVLGNIINGDIAGKDISDKTDPAIGAYTIRDGGASVTSASGTINGTSQGSRTTDVSGFADGHVNASKLFNLSGNQTLTVGGFFNYDAQSINFGAPTAISGATSAYRNIYTLGAAANYSAWNTYFGVGIAGEAGNGDINGGGVTGNFNSQGYVAAGYVGHVFNLLGAPIPNTSPGMITKAVARQSDTYSVYLDLKGSLGYVNDQINGFTDSLGNVRGAEQISYGDAGGQAKLIWQLPRGASRVTWAPYIAGTIDQQFGYSHSLAIPGDQLNFGSAQTFGGVKIGVDAFDISGIRFGAQAYYRQSQEYQVVGGMAYVKFPVLVWLGLQPAAR